MKKSNNKKKKRGIIGFIFRFIYKSVIVLLSLLFILSVIIFIVFKFDKLRQPVVNYAVKQANSFLLADVSLEDIQIHRLNYIQLKELLITVRQDTMLYARRVNLNFNPLSFTTKEFKITRLKFEDAVVNIERFGSDSVWNYNLIAPPAPKKEEEPGAMPDLTLNVKDIQFFRSKFTYRDSISSIRLNSNPKHPHMDFTDFQILDLFADIDAKLKLAENIYEIQIDELKAKEKYSGFILENFSADVVLDEEGIRADDLAIKTSSSKIELNANLTNLSIFKPIDVSKIIFNVNLEAGPIDIRDVLYFAQTGISIQEADNIKISTNGTLNDLIVNNLEIKNNATELKLKGTVRNLLDIENFNYSLFVENSNIKRRDIISIIPEFETVLPPVNDLNIRSIEANGYLDSVYTHFDIISDAGNAKGTASIMYLDNMNYFIDIKTEKFNLAKITGNKELNSSVTGDIFIDGSGITLETVNAKMDIDIGNSFFSDYNISKLILKAESSKDSKIILDSLYVELPRNIEEYSVENGIFDEDKSYLLASGNLDRSKEIPEYKLNIDYSALNISKLLDNSEMPEYISGNMKIESRGLKPDDIEGYLNTSFEEILFDDRALFPFDLNVQVNHPDSISKEIVISSDFFDIWFRGIYNFEDLFASLNYQNVLIQRFISEQNRLVYNDEQSEDNDSLKDDFYFPVLNAEIDAEINNITPIAAFLDNMDLYFKGDFNLNIRSDSTQSKITLNKLNINNMSIIKNGFTVRSGKHSFSGDILFERKDSINKLSELSFALNKSSEFYIAGNKFDSTFIDLAYKEQDLKWKFNTLMRDEIFAQLNGDITRNNKNFLLNINNMLIDYIDVMKINNSETIDLTYNNGNININNFNLDVDSLNKMQITGDIDLFKNTNPDDTTQKSIFFDDLLISLEYDNLQKFTRFLSGDLKSKLSSLNADLTGFNILLNGDISNIDADFNTEIADIRLQGFNLGKLNSSAHISDHILKFDAIMTGDNKKEYLNANLSNLNLNKENYAIDSLSKISASVHMSNLPLPLASPFIPNLNNITGEASADIDITGSAINPDINGILSLSKTSFILENNNIKYLADGDVNFTMDEIETSNLVLKNTKRDSDRGQAKVNAKLKLKNFVPEYFDISVEAKQFKVLSNASQDPMPDLYGDLIVSTGNNPLSFTGTLNDPLLAGDVDVIFADLKMPEFTQQQQAKTQLRYQIVGDKVQQRIINKRDSLIRLVETESSDISKVLDFNMRVKLLGQVSVLIDLGALGEIYANVAMQNRDEAIIYQKNTERKTENLTGKIVLKESSTFKSFKVLQTSGEISFPTGKIDNPYLDLEATYKGTTMINNQPKQYTVILYITGSQEKPDVKFTYLIDGQEAVGDPKQIEEDAILLLVAGRTKNSSGQGAASPDMLQQSLNSGISNYGSQLLTDFLMKTGSIQSVDLDFKGEGIEEATVKFTGQTELFGGNVNWTIGGALSDFSSNNEIILDVPLTNYTENEFWRNFIFQFTRASHTNTTIQDQNSKNWEIKFKVGGSF